MRTKKKEAEMCGYEELEWLADKDNARKFYEKMDFNRGSDTCRIQRSDPVTDTQSVLNF